MPLFWRTFSTFLFINALAACSQIVAPAPQAESQSELLTISRSGNPLDRRAESMWAYSEAEYQAVINEGNVQRRCADALAVPEHQIRRIDAHALMTANADLDCRFDFVGPQFMPDGSPVKTIVIEGRGENQTTLDFRRGIRRCQGIAMTVRGNAPTLVVRNVKLLGGYYPWANDRRTIPKAESSEADAALWQAGIWAAGRNNLACVSRVKVERFYYGLQAEDEAWVKADRVMVTNAGDGGFFAYDGGKLFVEGSSAGYASDQSRHLGFGFVAEALHWNYRRPYNHTLVTHTALDCRDEVVRRLGRYDLLTDRTPAMAPSLDGLWGGSSARRHEGEALLDRTDAYHLCLVRRSAEIPLRRRSFIFGRNVGAFGNRVAGVMANYGSDIVLEDLTATGSYGMQFDGKYANRLNDANLVRPNVYEAGEYPQGLGVVARYGSRIRADRSLVHDNLFGIVAWRGSSVSAIGSRVYDNSFYGFHATRESLINASHSWAFGTQQKYHFAVQQDNPSAINVSASLTPLGGQRIGQMRPFLDNPWDVWIFSTIAPSYSAATVDFTAPIRHKSQSAFGLYYE